MQEAKPQLREGVALTSAHVPRWRVTVKSLILFDSNVSCF